MIKLKDIVPDLKSDNELDFNTMIKLAEYVKGEALTFRDEMRDYRAGESFMTLYAIDKDNINVGSISYSIYDNEISVQYIQTLPSERRKGIASAMAKELQRLNPNKEILWGGLTPQGSKFLDKLPRTYSANNRYGEIVKRMELLKKKKAILDNIYKAWNDLYEKDRPKAEASRAKVNSYNELYRRVDDEIYELERELIPVKSGEWKVNPND